MSFFTKSNLMSYYQCPKRLWLEEHNPEAGHDRPDEMIIANGEAVGEMAREIISGGVHIETLNHEAALQVTQQHLADNSPLYEPAFEYADVRVRVDILHDDTLTEVKSGTKSKPHYLTDAAIQAWVTHNAGQKLQKVQLALVDSDFTYQGSGYDGLLKFEDITEQVLGSFKDIPGLVENAHATLAGDEPLVATGRQCKNPHPCPFQDYCNTDRPEYPVESLPRAGKIVDTLHQEDIYAIEDIPENWLTNEIHERVRRTVISGKPEIDVELVTMVKELPYPCYYLDFEAIGFAVPIWKGTNPHQHLPFQWSCHIEDTDGNIEHKEFLNISGEPPMRKFAESLLEALGNTGAILVYSSYEKRMLVTLQKLYPDLADGLAELIERLVDLLPPMRKHFYHPKQHGSWSIKALLPIVASDLNYKDLNEVHNGTEAQMAFMNAIASNTPPATRKQLEKDMLAYCELDTLAMVRLVGFVHSMEK